MHLGPTEVKAQRATVTVLIHCVIVGLRNLYRTLHFLQSCYIPWSTKMQYTTEWPVTNEKKRNKGCTGLGMITLQGQLRLDGSEAKQERQNWHSLDIGREEMVDILAERCWRWSSYMRGKEEGQVKVGMTEEDGEDRKRRKQMIWYSSPFSYSPKRRKQLWYCMLFMSWSIKIGTESVLGEKHLNWCIPHIVSGTKTNSCMHVLAESSFWFWFSMRSKTWVQSPGGCLQYSPVKPSLIVGGQDGIWASLLETADEGVQTADSASD